MKAINDNSWFSKIRQILAIYELPSSHNILDFPLTKNCLEKDGQQKSSDVWTLARAACAFSLELFK
jgi:hypothetical protein